MKVLFLLSLSLLCTEALYDDYLIGAGIYDITGPAAEAGMMGYASPTQSTNGLHFRQRSRAYIFDNNKQGDANRRIVFVSTDTCMIHTEVKIAVLEKLQRVYGSLYVHDNVMMSGTHTHSGPGGYAYYALYDVTTFGFHKPTFDVIVDGIYQSIVRAHANLSKGGRILINQGTVDNANINRSPSAYDNNPAAEKANYTYNTDHGMTLLRLQNEQGVDLGMINWFSVHGTSMNNSNGLISGDNKGYASLIFEKQMNNNSLPGTGPFVAAFAQTNEGDVSPNTRGAFCPDGTPCEYVHSTCGGKTEGCRGIGPGKTQFESTEIIGTYQLKAALSLFQNAATQLRSGIDFIHTFVAMENVTVEPSFSPTGKVEHTCEPALGDGFAAGTTDGPGDFDFKQGSNSTKDNPFFNFIAGFLSRPTAAQKQCHFPKPILLNVGGINYPLPWVPHIIPIQVFRLGDLYILGVPGEFTTMSGRRLRDTIYKTLVELGVANSNTNVVIAGLSNVYTHYIATYEEYIVQRYEGASTLYGPFTLAAYQQLFSGLVTSLVKGQPVPPGPSPPDLSGKTFNFQPPVIVDGHPSGKPFGSVDVDVNKTKTYMSGDIVTVSFWGASPRNNFMTEATFLTVEKLSSDQKWELKYTDSHWETKFHWKRSGVDHSIITIEWEINDVDEAGSYRIRTFGYSKNLIGELTPYEGTSSVFTVGSKKVLLSAKK